MNAINSLNEKCFDVILRHYADAGTVNISLLKGCCDYIIIFAHGSRSGKKGSDLLDFGISPGGITDEIDWTLARSGPSGGPLNLFVGSCYSGYVIANATAGLVKSDVGKKGVNLRCSGVQTRTTLEEQGQWRIVKDAELYVRSIVKKTKDRKCPPCPKATHAKGRAN